MSDNQVEIITAQLLIDKLNNAEHGHGLSEIPLKVKGNIDFAKLTNSGVRWFYLSEIEFLDTVDFTRNEKKYRIEFEDCQFSEIIFSNDSDPFTVGLENCLIDNLYAIEAKNTLTIENCAINNVKILSDFSGNYHFQQGGKNPDRKYRVSYGFIDKPYIKSLSIRFGNNTEGMRLVIEGYEVEDITLTGKCSGDILFEDIKGNTSTMITGFVNNGSFKIFGFNVRRKSGQAKLLQISRSDFGRAQIIRFNFESFEIVSIYDSFIADTLFNNVKWKEELLHYNNVTLKQSDVLKMRESYRQLKLAMRYQADRIQELRFYSDEMNVHYLSLEGGRRLPTKNFFKDSYWDKLILKLSKVFSNYGLSFWSPVRWFLIIESILFLFLQGVEYFMFCPVCYFDHSLSSFINRLAIEYLTLFIPFKNIDSYDNFLIELINVLSTIVAAYFVFLLIRYSRKFISYK